MLQLTPNLSSFKKIYQERQSVLLSINLPADMETPISALLKTKDLYPNHSLFESVQDGNNRGRYSIISLGADLIWKNQNNKTTITYNPYSDKPEVIGIDDQSPFISLRKLMAASHITPEQLVDLPPMAMGLFGYMNYDMVRYMENLPDNNPDTINIPTSIFFRPEVLIVFDSVNDSLTIISAAWFNDKIAAEDAYKTASSNIENVINKLQQPTACSYGNFLNSELEFDFASNMTKEDYAAMIDKAKEYIYAGDIFQVVLSQRFQTKFTFPPIALYRSLRHLNPSPYLFYMNFADYALVGSSPEILVRLENNTVTIRPIAGTRKRGNTATEDLDNEQDLLNDPKELSEHLMLLDLGRNDVGRVSQPGSVKVTAKMIIERYSHVMHIVSNVEGQLLPGKDAIDALIAGFPVGTVSGAPKIRAMEIIDELEPHKRSYYAGCVGYLSVNGDMDTCISLRTALVKDNILTIQAGGGVVADSTAEGEYQESCNKARALMRAASLAGRFVTKESNNQ